MVVVVDGVLVFERYAEGSAPTDRLLGNSATKSVLALLTGIAWADGSLGDLDTPSASTSPSLGTGYHGVTVRQVLTMTSGVGVGGGLPRSRQRRASRRRAPGGRHRRNARPPVATGTEAAPGLRYVYCSPDSMVLDWVRERATGQPFAEALPRLWQRIGAEHPAVVWSGRYRPRPAESRSQRRYVGLTARDWARIGLDAGRRGWIDDTDVVPKAWVEASSRPEAPSCGPDGCRAPSRRTRASATTGGRWILTASV